MALTFRRDGSRPWSWVEVEVLRVLVQVFHYPRPQAGALLRRGRDETAGACHRNKIKIRQQQRGVK